MAPTLLCKEREREDKNRKRNVFATLSSFTSNSLAKLYPLLQKFASFLCRNFVIKVFLAVLECSVAFHARPLFHKKPQSQLMFYICKETITGPSAQVLSITQPLIQSNPLICPSLSLHFFSCDDRKTVCSHTFLYDTFQ